MRRLKKWIALGMAACLSVSTAMPAAAGDLSVGTEAQEGARESADGIDTGIDTGINTDMYTGIDTEIPDGLSLEEAFPDPAFRTYAATHVDMDGDGLLSAQEAEAVTELSLSGLGITSLRGIGYFTGLQTLDCSDNQIGAMDLTGLDQLQTLISTGNTITLQADGSGQVDFSQIPDMDPSRIREISQGTWIRDGLLQLPMETDPGQLTYIYAAAGNDPAQLSWDIEIAVDLEQTQTEEIVVSENAVSENIPSVSADKTPKDTPKIYNEELEGPKLASGGVTAASDSAAIKSCKIKSNKKTIQVKASIPRQVKSQDKYYYLFASSPASTKLAAKPAAKVKKRKSVTFSTPLNLDNAKNRLQSRFQVAVKIQGKYKAISKEKYISNPEILADSTLPFTKGRSKKGLQFGESLPDAISLGTNYCLFNQNITELMKPGGLKYRYKGKTYDFNAERFYALGNLYAQLQDAGMNLSVEFLLPWADGQTDLIHPAARQKGAHNYYAWNISSQSARNKYEALFSCIAEWFNGKNGHGYINNYLIGNEVNAYNEWHYTGSTSLKTNADLYADTFQVVYMAVKSKCKNARVSICLDHSWNLPASGRAHSSREFLDQFATRLKKYGSPTFAIGYHAYSEPLTQSDFWNSSAQYVKDSTDSPCITMKNIQYLTQYVKSKYGSKTRIMLTEQGFSSHGTNGEKKQAAAIAYAFYKAEFNGMIDCIIFRSQADAQVEIANYNLHMGLWTSGMGKKKAAYNVYKYMDTNKCETYTRSCKQYLGISKWTQKVPGYKANRFKNIKR